MKIVLSPAKSLDYDSELPTDDTTQPRFLDEAEKLNNELAQKSKDELKELMNISQNLADLNYERYQKFSTPFTKDNARPCIYAFNGSAYKELDAYSIDESDVQTLQNSLRILSGMYGLLRPLDLMQPYRLEMGTKLATEEGKNLYEFWGDTIKNTVEKAVRDSGDNTLVNLASNEYYKSVKEKQLDLRVVTPQFKEAKDGGYKMIGLFAKRARGMMTRYAIDNGIEKPEELKGFDWDGYQFNSNESNGDQWVFTRESA